MKRLCCSSGLDTRGVLSIIPERARNLFFKRIGNFHCLKYGNMKTEVTAALKTQPAKWYLWSDSSVVLHWLRKIPSTLKVFGPHHVTKILEVSEPEMWRHVRTAANSADCLSIYEHIVYGGMVRNSYPKQPWIGRHQLTVQMPCLLSAKSVFFCNVH